MFEILVGVLCLICGWYVGRIRTQNKTIALIREDINTLNQTIYDDRTPEDWRQRAEERKTVLQDFRTFYKTRLGY